MTYNEINQFNWSQWRNDTIARQGYQNCYWNCISYAQENKIWKVKERPRRHKKDIKWTSRNENYNIWDKKHAGLN